MDPRRAHKDTRARASAPGDQVQVGFVVGKNVGNAVTRNRVRRRLRHLAAAELPRTSDPVSVVVRALPRAATAPTRCRSTSPPPGRRPSPGWPARPGGVAVKYVLIGLLKAYRLVISPLYGNVCRYYPSCSAYALRAVEVHGAVKGSWLAGRRLLRCHPWAPGGYDPVPGTPEWAAEQAEQAERLERSRRMDRYSDNDAGWASRQGVNAWNCS